MQYRSGHSCPSTELTRQRPVLLRFTRDPSHLLSLLLYGLWHQLFSCSVMSDSLQPHGLQPLFFTISQNLLKLNSIESVIPSNHLILFWPLLLLPSVFPSIRVFSSEWALHIRWPKCWSFSFSISPSNEYSGLISFRIDWLDFLVVQGTLKSLLQHHRSKASILLALSLPYSKTLISIHVYEKIIAMTTEKIITLTIRTFIRKEMSVLFVFFILLLFVCLFVSAF